MKHDRRYTVDFSLFYLGFDPIKIAMLGLAKLSIDLKRLFIPKQSPGPPVSDSISYYY